MKAQTSSTTAACIIRAAAAIVIFSAAFVFSSCLSLGDYTAPERPTKGNTYADLYEEKPEVLLIMPPINNSTNVSAKDFFYTTMSVPLAEAGYYVLPPFLTMEIMQRESGYDAELFIDRDLSQFREIFGADVAVFTIIQAWDKSMLENSVSVTLEYIFKSTKTNRVLYHKKGVVYEDTSMYIDSGDDLFTLIASIAASALSTALTDYMTLAKESNSTTIADLPAGKYSHRYWKDRSDRPTPQTIYINK